MPKPDQVSKADYTWCDECGVYVPNKYLTVVTGLFSDSPKGKRCPEGHTIPDEVKA